MPEKVSHPDPDFYGDGEQHGAAVGEPLGHETKLEPGREWDYGAGLPPIAPFGRISALGSWEAESSPPAPALVQAREKDVRFGDRLRERAEGSEIGTVVHRGELMVWADAIDQDAGRLVEEMDRRQIASADHVRNLRQQVEEAVERGRYGTETVSYTRVEGETPHYRGEPGKKDILDAEPFLAELDRIFGERRADEGAGVIRAALGWCVTQEAGEQADILREACLVYLKSQPAVSYEDRHRHDKEEVGGAIYEAALAANQTTREICQRCHTVSAIGFHAPTETWRAVAGRDWANSILCIRCFAALGDEKFIAWERGLAFYPVSYASHHTERFGRSVP